MDPISLGLSLFGMGLSLFGGHKQADNSKAMAEQSAAQSTAIDQDEQKINEQRQQQMKLEANRAQLENFRNAQRARAQATSAAVNQGAQFGTGLAGGLSSVTNQSLQNSRSINQEERTSENIFGINNDISQHKIALSQINAQYSANQATDQGIMNLGGMLTKNAGTMSGLIKDAGAGMSGLFNPLAGAFSF